jgi:uncharacterized protein (TIGR02001 family)
MSLYRTLGITLIGASIFAAFNAMAQEAPAAADATAVAASAAAAPAADGPKWTGHVDVVSRYILRGITDTYGPSKPGGGNKLADAPESDKPALQWGADWTHPSGFYLGYWASTINYSYKALGKSYNDPSITDFQDDKSIENDLYGSYTGKIGDFGYTVGMTGYVYINGKNSDALETKLGVSYGDFALNAQTLLKDTVWGNKGDTYWTLNYTKPLPYDITLNASLGYYTYHKEGKYLGTVNTSTGVACGAGESFNVSACVPGNAPSGSGFRHLIVGITQPIGSTGVTWGLQGLIGGENRFSVNQSSKLLASLSYGF